MTVEKQPIPEVPEERMAEFEERCIGPWTIRIDRLICVGFGDCLDKGSDWFELDAEGIATFRSDHPEIPDAAFLEACRSCPVDAISVHDAEGRKIAP